ncbi:MAG: hypothetical protein GC159_15460 [Phycisphaera sp.]|nr:hypothetical protein [Phycisphaera sp.]
METTEKLDAPTGETGATDATPRKRRGVWAAVKGFFSAWLGIYGGCACNMDHCETRDARSDSSPPGGGEAR